jgi:hypothetical protein
MGDHDRLVGFGAQLNRDTDIPGVPRGDRTRRSPVIGT